MDYSKRSGKQQRTPRPKVVSGTVNDKGARPRSNRLFLGDTSRDVGFYVFGEVVLPAIRDILLRAVSGGFERMLYGDESPRNSASTRRGGYSYNGISTPTRANQAVASRPPTPPRTQVQSRLPHEVILATSEDAEAVKDQMLDILEEYQQVSLADFLDLVGLRAAHVDQRIGWRDLSGIRVESTTEGFRVVTPTPISL